jgi:hypothetical protein
MVDDCDYDNLIAQSVLTPWDYFDGVRGQIYARRNEPGIRGKGRKTIYMHREILGLSPKDGLRTMHLDRNGLNNVKTNLLKGTRSDQGARMRKGRSVHHKVSSRFTGVHLHNGKWDANITENQYEFFLGCFDLEEDAARRYDEAKRIRWGQNAVTNASEGRL